MAVLLAIETSQRAGSVALRAETGTIHLEALQQAGRHADDLMPAIDRLMRRIDAPPRSIDRVAVSLGPGSFTGLRIAVSTAKMLGETLGAKLMGVPSALVAAENLDLGSAAAAGEAGAEILIGLAGKRETFWASRLQRSAGFWREVVPPGLASAESVDLTGLAAFVADEHIPEQARRRCNAAGVPVVQPHFDAAACLRASEQLAAEGEEAWQDSLSLMPLYPRQPEAVSIWQSRKKTSPQRR